MAGYCSVLHAFSLLGINGDYGRPLSAAVISFGATARGAIRALSALGVGEVSVLTQRPVAAVDARFAEVRMLQFAPDPEKPGRTLAHGRRESAPLVDVLAEHDVVVNCILQDTDAPLMFVMDEDLAALPAADAVRRRLLRRGDGVRVGPPDLVRRADASTVGRGLRYYAVDHSPSYLWNAATWENSAALLPYLPIVMAGAARLGRRRDDPPRHRDPRGHRREPAHPLLPGARVDLPVRAQRSLTRPPPTSSTRSAIRSRK